MNKAENAGIKRDFESEFAEFIESGLYDEIETLVMDIARRAFAAGYAAAQK